MRTILVTGATGTVGSEVVKQLTSSSSGHEVVKAAVHSQDKADRFKRDNQEVEIVKIDYNRPETIANALNNVGKLFLLTLPAPNMTEISSNFVKEAKKNGVERIVKLSVMGADEEPGLVIGRLHRQAEKIIEDSGISYTFLQPGSFMQSFLPTKFFFGQTIKTQNAFYFPAGDGRIGFVDVRDIAAVAVQALTDDSQHTGKAYTITGQDALSYGQVAEILSNEVNKRISYVDISEEDSRRGMKQIGMEDWLIDAIMEFFSIVRAGHASQTTTEVKQITGRKPISFAQFAKDYAEFFK